MKSALVLLVCLLSAPTLHAMTWQELQTEIDSVESGNPPNQEIIARFSEMVQMLVTYYRAVQDTAPDAQLFCLQPSGSLQLDEIVSMVRAQARTGPAADDASVQELLLDSFRARFSCN